MVYGSQFMGGNNTIRTNGMIDMCVMHCVCVCVCFNAVMLSTFCHLKWNDLTYSRFFIYDTVAAAFFPHCVDTPYHLEIEHYILILVLIQSAYRSERASSCSH